jgi:hypothetical protein
MTHKFGAEVEHPAPLGTEPEEDIIDPSKEDAANFISSAMQDAKFSASRRVLSDLNSLLGRADSGGISPKQAIEAARHIVENSTDSGIAY